MPRLYPEQRQHLPANLRHALARRGMDARQLAHALGYTNPNDFARYTLDPPEPGSILTIVPGAARLRTPLIITGPVLRRTCEILGVDANHLLNLPPETFAHRYHPGPVPTEQTEIPTGSAEQLPRASSEEQAPRTPGWLRWAPGLAVETPTPVGPSSSGTAHEPVSSIVAARLESASPPPATLVNPVNQVNPVPANTLSPMEISALREALPPRAAAPVPRRASRQERLDLLDLWQRRRITTRELDYALGGATQ